MFCNSIDALQQLLIRDNHRYQENEKANNNDNQLCHITKKSSCISFMRNGIKYYCLEVTCGDGIQYGIQAYGEEAETLYKEAHRCILCGRTNYMNQEKKLKLVDEIIDGTHYIFDTGDCAIIFKKFKSVYGGNFYNSAGN